MSSRHTGTVKWFNTKKGFGFIKPDDRNVNEGSDVFVHISAVEKAGLRVLHEDQKVTFVLEEHRGKTQASALQAA